MSLSVRRFFSVSGLTFVSRATGFATVLMMGAALGLSRMSDALTVARILPQQFYELVLGGLMGSVFIPMFARRRAKEAPWTYRREAGSLCATLLLWMAVVSVFASLGAPWVVRILLLQTEDPQTIEYAATFFRILAFQIFFVALSGLGGALLNAEGKFNLAAGAPVLNNVVIIASLALFMWKSETVGLTGLALGIAGGAAAMALVQWIGLASLGFFHGDNGDRTIIRIRPWHPLLWEVFRFGAPILGLLAVAQLGILVRANLASSVEGGFTALQYIYRFFMLPYGILGVTIGTLVVPGLAHSTAKGDTEAVQANVRRAFLWTCFIMLPCAVVYAFLAKPIIRFSMEYGRFGASDSQFLGELLYFYALAVFPYSVLMLIARFFYATANVGRAVLMMSAVNLLNIALCFLFFDQAGIHGIAFAVFLSYSLGAIGGLFLLKRTLSGSGD